MGGLVRKRGRLGCTICGLALAITYVGPPGPVRGAQATRASQNGVLALVNPRGVWTVDEHGDAGRPVFTDSRCLPAEPSAAFSPDGRWLAMLAYNPCRFHYEDLPGAIQLTVVRMTGLGGRHVVTVPANPHVSFQTFDGPQFSPNGKTIAYAVGPTAVSHDSRYTSHLVLVGVRSGRPRLIISVVSRKPPLKLEAATYGLPFAFAPDSREIAFVPPDSARIVIASARTGRLLHRIRTAGGAPDGLAWGAGGDRYRPAVLTERHEPRVSAVDIRPFRV